MLKTTARPKADIDRADNKLNSSKILTLYRTVIKFIIYFL